MKYPSLRFDIHGVVVEINVDDSEIRDILSSYLSYFNAAAVEDSDIIFSFERGGVTTHTIPEDAYWFFNYYKTAGFVHGGIYYYRCFDSVFRFDPTRSTIEAGIMDQLVENRRAFSHGIFTIVLMEALRYRGLYYLHAAGLESPGGTKLVITGDGASGKTTFSVALICSGWTWLTDDTLLLKFGPDGLELLPFWREFHIPPSLAEKISELKFLLDEEPYFPSNPKRALRGETLWGDLKVVSMKRPDVVLFSSIVDSRESRVEKMAVLDAVNEIIRNSPFVLFSKPPAKAHLNALKELVEGARCYRLYSGRDILENPVDGVEGILRLIGES